MLPLYLNYGGERYVLAAARKLVPAIKLKDSQGQPINRKVMVSPTTLQAHPELYRARSLSGGDLHGIAHNGDEGKQLEAVQHKEVHQHANINGTTPLHTLAKSASRKVQLRVLDHPHVHRVVDYRGRTPLHNAADTRWSVVARRVLRHPQVGKVQDQDGRTPLHLLAKSTSGTETSDVQRHILQHPDAGRVADKHGNTPLHVLARGAALPTLKAIIKHPSARRKRNLSGHTAADIAEQSLLTRGR